MRGIGRVTVRTAAICKPRRLLPAACRPSNSTQGTIPSAAIRSIYTGPNARPFGFGADPENKRSTYSSTSQLHGGALAHPQQHFQAVNQYENTYEHQRPQRSSEQLSVSGHTGFLPVPFVTEHLAGAHHSTDLFSRLLKERIVAVYGPVEDRMAATITASLLFLESESPDAPINLYINSPGGSVSAGLSIYDTMQYISPPIHTIVLGQAASMGSLLAVAGSPGKRYALPHATIMMHQPSGGYSGTSADIQIHAKEILRIRNQLNGIYRRHMNAKPIVERRGREISLEEIERLMDRDYFMSAEEAQNLGVVDEVLESRKKPVDEEKTD